jgi:hypothetical protein
MMKCLPALIILTVLLPVHGQDKSTPSNSNASKTSDLKQPTSNPHPTPPSPANPNAIEQQTAAAQENRAKEHPQSYLHRLFAPENLPNIALFFGGIGGIIVAICTLKIIERQTNATEDAAKAAKASAEVADWTLKETQKQFFISHRPWCAFAELPKTESALKFDDEGGKLEICYKVRNGGTSPAIAVTTVQELVISLSEAPNLKDLKERLEQLAPPDFLNTVTGLGGVLLLPGDIMEVPPSYVGVLKTALHSVQGKRIALFLLLCAAYRDESKAIHKTGSVYRFITSNGVRCFQPEGVIRGRFERFAVGYAD